MGLWDYENFFYVGRIVPSSHRPTVPPSHRLTVSSSHYRPLPTRSPRHHIYNKKNSADRSPRYFAVSYKPFSDADDAARG